MNSFHTSLIKPRSYRLLLLHSFRPRSLFSLKSTWSSESSRLVSAAQSTASLLPSQWPSPPASSVPVFNNHSTHVSFFSSHHPPVSPSSLHGLWFNTVALWLWLTRLFPSCMCRPIYIYHCSTVLLETVAASRPARPNPQTRSRLSYTRLYSLSFSLLSLQCGSKLGLWRLFM